MQLRYRGKDPDGVEVTSALELEHRPIADLEAIGVLRELVAEQTGLTDVVILAWG